MRIVLAVVVAVALLWSPADAAAAQTGPADGSAFPQERPTPSFHPRTLRPPNVPGRDEAVVVVPGDPRIQDRVRVVHWPGDEERARRVIETLEARPELPGLPAEYPAAAVIFLAPDEARWRALTGGRVPHWGAGVAIPGIRRIVLPVFQTPWDGFRSEGRTVRHEWAHLGLHDYLEGLRVPRWFDEGYAQWAAGGRDFSEGWRLRLALAGGGAPPLDSLSLAWPRDRAGAELAYLLSATAVEFLVRDSGPQGMRSFLERWREEGDFEEAFRRTFGRTTGTFERQWLEHVKRRYGWVLVMGESAVFWILLGGALFFLFRLRRRRDRERMARLRATEPPDDPAYWEPPRHAPFGGFAGERPAPGAGGKSVDPDRLPP